MPELEQHFEEVFADFESLALKSDFVSWGFVAPEPRGRPEFRFIFLGGEILC